jgi:hypothetical protein
MAPNMQSSYRSSFLDISFRTVQESNNMPVSVSEDYWVWTPAQGKDPSYWTWSSHHDDDDDDDDDDEPPVEQVSKKMNGLYWKWTSDPKNDQDIYWSWNEQESLNAPIHESDTLCPFHSHDGVRTRIHS